MRSDLLREDFGSQWHTKSLVSAPWSWRTTCSTRSRSPRSSRPRRAELVSGSAPIATAVEVHGQHAARELQFVGAQLIQFEKPGLLP